MHHPPLAAEACLTGRDSRGLQRRYLDQGIPKAVIAEPQGVSNRTVHHWIANGQLDLDLDKEDIYTLVHQCLPSSTAIMRQLGSLVMSVSMPAAGIRHADGTYIDHRGAASC
jgi:hypothetical protein